ncbi:MAG: DUF2470 domain-containing protein [Actinomycetota bacterium]
MTRTETSTDGAPSNAHDTSGPPIIGDVHSFPSYAELARTLVEGGAVASIATLGNDDFPYTSIAPISVDPNGAPVICVSSLAEHTRNLRRTGRSSVLVQERCDDRSDPLALARATYVGTFVEFEPEQLDIDRHLAAHPYAAHYIEFPDFGWWRFEVQHLRYVGGFGVMGWADASSFAAASPDPIIPHAAPMIAHLDDDHADACTAIAEYLGAASGATSATVTDVDRYGMTFTAHGTFDDAPVAVSRVAFPEPLTGPSQVRAASVDLVHRARTEATAT